MLDALKHKLVEARAEAALSMADLAIDRRDPREAAARFAEQARDLRARGGLPLVLARAWVGVLRAAALAATLQQPLPDELDAATDALLALNPRDLPLQWRPYEDTRPLLLYLLQSPQRAPRALALAQALAHLLPRDPRPRYVAARAHLLALSTLTDPDALADAARRALDAIEHTRAAAALIGAQRTWDEPLNLMAAALYLRHLAARDPDARARGVALTEAVSSARARDLSPPDALTVAQGWLGSARPMTRLRALDLLEALMTAPAMVEPGLRVLLHWLERLDWRFYRTEIDRVRGLLQAHADALGPQRVATLTDWLQLLTTLHDGADAQNTTARARLLRLRDNARALSPDAWAVAWYELALAIADAPPDAWRDALRAALQAHNAAPEALASSWRRDHLAWALGALHLRLDPDPALARALLHAADLPALATPHARAALWLLFPTLLAHWRAWPDLHADASRAIEAALQLPPRPGHDAASLAASLAALNEHRLASLAAARALEDPALPHDLRPRLLLLAARASLALNQPADAARRLLLLPP